MTTNRRTASVFIVVVIGLCIWSFLPTSPKPIPTKVSTQKIQHLWTRTDSLAFALDQLQANADIQFTCLENLWGKESGWNPKDINQVKSQGMKAGGIPQLLGLSPLVPPAQQIARGLKYITYRYITPCIAWHHWQKKGWY